MGDYEKEKSAGRKRMRWRGMIALYNTYNPIKSGKEYAKRLCDNPPANYKVLANV